MSNGFIYIRNAEDDAYVNHGNNFRGMEQASSGVVIMYFESALSTSGGASGTAYDKITLAVTANSEKQAMIDINGALFGGKAGSTTILADDYGGVSCSQYISSSAGVTTISKATSGVTSRIESLGGIRTVTAADSGTTFVLNAAAGYAITLAAASALGAGFKCKFVTGTLFATSDWVITATAAIMRGVIAEATGAATQSTIAGTTATFELGADSLGDYVELECDGTHIFINGMSITADSITLA